MLSCSDAAPLLAKRADGAELDAPAAEGLEQHLATCAGCRAALADQRAVRDILQSRPAQAVSPAFASRLSERLDDASGFFGIVDWRVWTYRLAPLAAVLAIIAVLFSSQSAAAPLSLEDWAVSNAGETSRATLLWNSDVSADTVIETMLVGDQASGGTGDGR